MPSVDFGVGNEAVHFYCSCLSSPTDALWLCGVCRVGLSNVFRLRRCILCVQLHAAVKRLETWPTTMLSATVQAPGNGGLDMSTNRSRRESQAIVFADPPLRGAHCHPSMELLASSATTRESMHPKTGSSPSREARPCVVATGGCHVSAQSGSDAEAFTMSIHARDLLSGPSARPAPDPHSSGRHPQESNSSCSRFG